MVGGAVGARRVSRVSPRSEEVLVLAPGDGFDHFLVKPVDSDVIADLLRAHADALEVGPRNEDRLGRELFG